MASIMETECVHRVELMAFSCHQGTNHKLCNVTGDGNGFLSGRPFIENGKALQRLQDNQ